MNSFRIFVKWYIYCLLLQYCPSFSESFYCNHDMGTDVNSEIHAELKIGCYRTILLITSYIAAMLVMLHYSLNGIVFVLLMFVIPQFLTALFFAVEMYVISTNK